MAVCCNYITVFQFFFVTEKSFSSFSTSSLSFLRNTKRENLLRHPCENEAKLKLTMKVEVGDEKIMD